MVIIFLQNLKRKWLDEKKKEWIEEFTNIGDLLTRFYSPDRLVKALNQFVKLKMKSTPLTDNVDLKLNVSNVGKIMNNSKSDLFAVLLL